jgi:Cu+-exporting ATPase
MTDPVCGMKVDRAKAIRKDLAGDSYYFCSEHCLHTFELDPDRYALAERSAEHSEAVRAH